MRIAPIAQDFSYKKNNTNTPYQITKTNLSYKADSISFEANLSQAELFKNLSREIKKNENGYLKKLFKPKQIQTRIKSLAKEIKETYGDNVYIICVMNGAKRFTDDLAKAMGQKTNGEIKLSSYGKSFESSGEIQVKNQNLPNIEKAKKILVIEDIVDSGNSMNFLLNKLKKEHPNAEVKLCTLLDKPNARKPGNDFKVDYTGFKIGNEFVIGYGLDYKENYRELDTIYQVIKGKKKVLINKIIKPLITPLYIQANKKPN